MTADEISAWVAFSVFLFIAAYEVIFPRWR